MAAEAAVLGTPSIRFSGFVGKLGYLNELEHTYGLTFGIPTAQPEKFLSTVKALIEQKDLKAKWQQKRRRMLDDKIDVNAFITKVIEETMQPFSLGVIASDRRERSNLLR